MTMMTITPIEKHGIFEGLSSRKEGATTANIEKTMKQVVLRMKACMRHSRNEIASNWYNMTKTEAVPRLEGGNRKMKTI